MPHRLDQLTWPRRTPRLSIRPAGAEDLDAVFAYRSAPEVSQWLSAWPSSVEALALHFGRSALVATHNGTIVGDLHVTIQDAWSQAEVADRAKGTRAVLGWCIAPAYQGHGYGTECVRELISIAFALGVRRVEAGCFAGNTVSRRVMVKAGLRQEGHFLQESLHRDGSWRDALSSALLAQEWAGAQQ